MYTNPVSMSYTNDSENLGYHLPPNSDEILVAFDWLGLPHARLRLRYQLVRHGANPSSAPGDPVIHGDVDRPYVGAPGVDLPRQGVPPRRALRLEQHRDALGQLGPPRPARCAFPQARRWRTRAGTPTTAARSSRIRGGGRSSAWGWKCSGPRESG